MNNTEQKFIYFEKQGSDMMCGVHCINSLLQGPYFDEVTMGEIALKLDQQERELLAVGGLSSKDYLKYMQEGSSNVANDGNFSMQTISEALKGFGDYSATPVENPEIKRSIKDYGDEEAFICHSVDHWIAIRKVYNVWYNLNSTNMYPPGPQIISDFYLSAFLDSIKNSGYTIFVVRGVKPIPLPNRYQFSGQLRSNQHYVALHVIETYHKDNKNRKLNVSGQDERELEEALQRSLKESYAKKDGKDDDDDDSAPSVGTILNGGKGKQAEEKKFEAFKGQGVSLGGQKEDVVMNEADAFMYEGYADDPELAEAIKLSMLEEEAKSIVIPDEPLDSDDPNSYTRLQLIMPDGKKIIRKFFFDNKIQDIMNFIKKNQQKYSAAVRLLTTGLPKKTIEAAQASQTIKDCGIAKLDTLRVELK